MDYKIWGNDTAKSSDGGSLGFISNKEIVNNLINSNYKLKDYRDIVFFLDKFIDCESVYRKISYIKEKKESNEKVDERTVNRNLKLNVKNVKSSWLCPRKVLIL